MAKHAPKKPRPYTLIPIETGLAGRLAKEAKTRGMFLWKYVTEKLSEK